jgi:hypothetical protein
LVGGPRSQAGHGQQRLCVLSQGSTASQPGRTRMACSTAAQHALSTDSEITKCLVKNTAAPLYGTRIALRSEHSRGGMMMGVCLGLISPDRLERRLADVRAQISAMEAAKSKDGVAIVVDIAGLRDLKEEEAFLEILVS